VRSFFFMNLLVDAHQDLAWNMLTFGRDYTHPVEETRRLEKGKAVVEYNGDTLLSWHEYQRGRVALIFATLFAAPLRARTDEWDTQFYADADQAHRIYSGHLDVYARMFDQHSDKFRPVRTTRELGAIIDAWDHPAAEGQGYPVGIVHLMEGADGIRHIEDLEEWWDRGVRIIGPAWMATRYCGGTREPGPLTDEGHALLEAMSDFGFTLDLSHMAWESARQALDLYEGPIIASHSNALRLVKGSESNRHLTDDIIERIIEREGVIGIVPFNRFLVHGWKNSDPRSAVPLELVAAQIDYVCQMAGNARHVGFGTDFDGGFGLQHVPPEIDTIVDLHKLVPLLEARGYTDDNIAAIFGGNWINHLRKNLPNS
jgi:membrane dipeptidase